MAETIWLEQEQLEVMRMSPDVVRETVLERAVATGKIPPERRDYYREQYQRDQPGTVHLLASLAPGVKPSDAKKLANAERQQDEDVLTAARNVFPELRRRTRSLPPPVASATVAGEGEGSTAAPLPSAAHRAGWYRRRGSSSRTLKDVAPARTPWWPTGSADVPIPAPFPAGLEVK
jgi:hypothetical protein